MYYSLGKIILGKIVVKMWLDVCVLKNVLLNFEVLAHQYLLQFYMNLYAEREIVTWNLMIVGYILCCETCLSVGMYGMEGWLFNTMPD